MSIKSTFFTSVFFFFFFFSLFNLKETFYYSQKLVKFEHRSYDGTANLVEVHDFHSGMYVIVLRKHAHVQYTDFSQVVKMDNFL